MIYAEYNSAELRQAAEQLKGCMTSPHQLQSFSSATPGDADPSQSPCWHSSITGELVTDPKKCLGVAQPWFDQTKAARCLCACDTPGWLHHFPTGISKYLWLLPSLKLQLEHLQGKRGRNASTNDLKALSGWQELPFLARPHLPKHQRRHSSFSVQTAS